MGSIPIVGSLVNFLPKLDLIWYNSQEVQYIYMDEQQSPILGGNTPIYQESQDKNAKWLWILIFLIIVGALVFAVVRGIGPFANLNLFKQQIQASPSPESSPFVFASPTPQATSGAELNKSLPKIRVLNGSGKAGVASAMKDFLEGLDYQVTAVGNANSYNFEQTMIRFKEKFKEFEETLINDLSDKYSAVASSQALEATDSADIEVIVGAK